MKKLLTALLALSVVGAVYAADPALKVSGYVNGGMKLTSNSVDTKVLAYADDDGNPGSVGYVRATYTADNAGAKVTVKGYDSPSSIAITDAYAWVSPLAGLQLIGGKSYTDIFDGVDDDSNDYFDSNGVSAIYSMAGLSVGFGEVMTSTATGVEDGGFVFGAGFDLPKMLKLRLNGLTAGTSDLAKISASVAYTGVENLLISGGFLGESMNVSASKSTWIDATVKYTMDALFAQVVFYDFLDKEYMTIAPRVGYNLNKMWQVYGQVNVVTEGKDAVTNYATIKPRAQVQFKPDAATTMYARVEYDTEKEASTVLLQYVWSF